MCGYKALLGPFLVLAALVSARGGTPQIVLEAQDDCALVPTELALLEEHGAQAKEFCSVYVTPPPVSTVTQSVSTSPPLVTQTQYSTITPEAILSIETSIVPGTATETVTKQLPLFLKGFNYEAVTTACKCMPVSQVTTTTTVTESLPAQTSITSLVVTLPATISTSTTSISTIISTTTVIVPDFIPATESDDESEPVAPEEAPEPIPQLIRNPSWAEDDHEWSIEAENADGWIRPNVGHPDRFDEDDHAFVFSGGNPRDPVHTAAPGSMSISQYVALDPTKRYELSYFQGLGHQNSTDAIEKVEWGCLVSAKLGRVQVMPPDAPCGLIGKGKAAPGSCTAAQDGWREPYGLIFYEQKKAIVSPLQEGNQLSLSIECSAPKAFWQWGTPSWRASYMLDTITLTPID